jgi:glucose-1-phosphate cytidylyltransferase
MKHYSFYGFNEFVILLGYKGYYIKEYFANYFLHQSDVTFDMSTGKMQVHNNSSEPWKVTLLDTGLDSMTGERIKRAQEFIGEETFMLTYGDGISDLNIKDLVKFHNSHNSVMTITSAQPEGRFGSLELDGSKVLNFEEKPKGDGGWINAGFFVCDSKVFDYIELGKNTIFEKEPLINLTKDNQVCAFRHEGFWKPMDTLRDKLSLQKLWETNNAPWKVW